MAEPKESKNIDPIHLLKPTGAKTHPKHKKSKYQKCVKKWKWQKVINQTFKNMIYCQNIFQKRDLLVNKVLKVCLGCVFDTDDSM